MIVTFNCNEEKISFPSVCFYLNIYCLVISVYFIYFVSENAYAVTINLDTSESDSDADSYISTSIDGSDSESENW